MFTPSRAQARQLFFDTWKKYRASEPLEGLQRTVAEVVLMHPEYQPLLDQPERYADRDYLPEAGAINPFLHLSLHLAIAEQLAIDQPQGIRSLFQTLAEKSSEHEALHMVLDCLGEIVWEASRNGSAPDEARYLDCLKRKAGLRG